MKDVLKYKSFIGSVHFDAEDKVFYGKIEGINDLVTFEGRSVEKLIKAFHEAVEDYVALCKKVGKEPLKSTTGSFNVRILPEIHRKALEKAALYDMSLNQLVQKAIEKEVSNELNNEDSLIFMLKKFKKFHEPFKGITSRWVVAAINDVLKPEYFKLHQKRLIELKNHFSQYKGYYEEKLVHEIDAHLKNCDLSHCDFRKNIPKNYFNLRLSRYRRNKM